MTFSTKLSISVIATLILAGMFAFTTPTHAGFFDWLTGSGQTAQISKAVDSRTTATMSASTEVEVKPTFFQRLFSKQPSSTSLSNEGGNTTLSSNQCNLSNSMMDQILDLMDDEFGATEEAMDAMEELMEEGETSVVMTAPSGLSQSEINQINALLTAFGCDGSFIYLVNDTLNYQTSNPAMNDECLIVTHISAQNSSTVVTPPTSPNYDEVVLGRFTVENDCGEEVDFDSIDFSVLASQNVPYFGEIVMSDTLTGSMLAYEENVTIRPGFNGSQDRLQFTFDLSNSLDLEDGEVLDFTVYTEDLFNGVAQYNIVGRHHFVIGIKDIDYEDGQTGENFSYGESEWGDIIRLEAF